MNVMTATPELPFFVAVHESARRVVHEVKGRCTGLSALYAESVNGGLCKRVTMRADAASLGDCIEPAVLPTAPLMWPPAMMRGRSPRRRPHLYHVLVPEADPRVVPASHDA